MSCLVQTLQHYLSEVFPSRRVLYLPPPRRRRLLLRAQALRYGCLEYLLTFQKSVYDIRSFSTLLLVVESRRDVAT